MSLAKYCLGIHNYQPNNAPVNVYTAGELASYLTAIGSPTPTGALAHTKLKDSAGRWQAGNVPPTWGTGGHDYLFIQEAKALGFVTVGAWVPGSDDPDNYPWDFINDSAAMANFDAAAAACTAVYQDVDVWLFSNEREVFGQTTEAERAVWFALENRAGQIWQGLGKGWMAGADQSISGFLNTLSERLAVYASRPDWWAVHAYGNGGFTARNVRDVRRTLTVLLGYEPSIAFTEWAVDFENLVGYGTKAWVRDYRAREFIEHVGRALRRERCSGCFFTLKELMQESPDYLPRAGIVDAISDTQVAANPPSMDPQQAGAVTWRYLSEGVYLTDYWGAAWQGIREFARSTASYPGYWD